MSIAPYAIVKEMYATISALILCLLPATTTRQIRAQPKLVSCCLLMFDFPSNVQLLSNQWRPPTPEFPDYDDFSSGIIIVSTPMTGSNDKASSRRQLSEGYMKASLSMDVLHKQKQLKSHHNPHIPPVVELLFFNSLYVVEASWYH